MSNTLKFTDNSTGKTISIPFAALESMVSAYNSGGFGGGANALTVTSALIGQNGYRADSWKNSSSVSNSLITQWGVA